MLKRRAVVSILSTFFLGCSWKSMEDFMCIPLRKAMFWEMILLTGFLSTNCVPQEKTRTTADILYGVWLPVGEKTEASGGVGNAGLIIEHNDVILPVIGGLFRIVSIDPIGNDVFSLIFYFDRGSFNVEYLVHYDPSAKTIWFGLKTPPDVGLLSTGPQYRWYRVRSMTE